MRQLLWVLPVVALSSLFPLEVAHAHVPAVQARTFCDGGDATLEWTVRSSGPSTGWEHHNVTVEISIDFGAWTQVGTAELTAANGFTFVGTTVLPDGAGAVRVRNKAIGPWSSGLVNEVYTFAQNMTFSEAEADNIAVPTDCVS